MSITEAVCSCPINIRVLKVSYDWIFFHLKRKVSYDWKFTYTAKKKKKKSDGAMLSYWLYAGKNGKEQKCCNLFAPFFLLIKCTVLPHMRKHVLILNTWTKYKYNTRSTSFFFFHGSELTSIKIPRSAIFLYYALSVSYNYACIV